MTHTVTDALDAGDVTKLGVGLTIAVVVIGVLLFVWISHIIVRIVIVVVVIALGVFIWQQRSAVENKIDAARQDACGFHATFFGVHLGVPDHVRQLCQQQRNRRGG